MCGAASVSAETSAAHWAYQPLVKPAVPDISGSTQAKWVRSPVDAFVLAALESRAMRPSGPADKRTLLRRVYFDLIGLPPTPEDVNAFLADISPDAYEKVVDRLLASPRYGERWARHWMDVVHFAETHGHDQDRIRPNAWPYRDYLISSLNSDKPYARFVQEQLAGDVLFPDDPQAVVALGMIAAGPWDESSIMAIMDDTVDKKAALYLDRDDMVMTAMSTFTSTTVHCARCHDHKFDPVPQQEYYALQAVFAGVDRANRPYDSDPQVYHRRRELLKRKKELESNGAALAQAALKDPASAADVAAWEKGLGAKEAAWTVLQPFAATSSGGATPATQSDGSVLFGGARPEKDVYTIQASTDLKGITAVRLEVLPDDSLPSHGPGRAENGNLHLSEFKLLAAARSASAPVQAVSLQNPTADFDQDGWTIAMALDGKPETAWGIHPAEAKRHVAVFETKEPIGADAGSTLTFSLEQVHGRGHVIGKLRLSVANSPQPVRATKLPESIASVLATTAEKRTDAQRQELALHVMKARVEEQLAGLPPPKMVFAAANDFPVDGNFKPANGCRPIQVLRRGDVTAPIADAAPGALSCVQGLDARFDLPNAGDEGARRAALAKWVTDPKNALTWRSIVNRVWHYHFGRGIVDTPNDLGRMGGKPSHPELLDWLATWFVDHGGSLKQLHRLIVTSSTYMQSSRHDPEFTKIDSDNRLLWRMNRARLDAESIRDAVLQMTGKLDLTMGGPSVKQFIESPGIHVTPNVDYLNFDVDSPAFHRRSVYRFIFRTLPDPFMETLDCADASQLAPVRSSSVTALQALSMMNDAFVVRYSEHLAERLTKINPDPSTQIDALYALAYSRPPTADERRALTDYASRHGMANACRLLLNSNEFMFVN
jgi:hypothetical protein